MEVQGEKALFTRISTEDLTNKRRNEQDHGGGLTWAQQQRASYAGPPIKCFSVSATPFPAIDTVFVAPLDRQVQRGHCSSPETDQVWLHHRALREVEDTEGHDAPRYCLSRRRHKVRCPPIGVSAFSSTRYFVTCLWLMVTRYESCNPVQYHTSLVRWGRLG